MTPELSRRIAHALHRLGSDVPLRRRLRVGPAAEPADTFGELPKWIQDLVVKAEQP